MVSFNTVSPGWFRAMGIPLLAGRDFTDGDDDAVAVRLVVDRAFARRHFPGEADDAAVGRRLFLGRATTPYEIVGVVGEVRHAALATEPAGLVYLCSLQRTVPGMTMVLRTADPGAGSPPSLALAGEVRRRVAALDPDQPVARLETLDEVVARSLADRRFTLLLVGLFAAVALVLAALGLFGVLAQAVGRRTGEIGLRMALGAERRSVVGLVVGRGLALTAAGLAIGIGVAAAATRLLAGLLYGVRPTDPLTFAAIAVLLAATALAASYLPARRAAGVDPLDALRRE